MDKISDLPDDIVSFILEKLPLIDRVRMSCLSRSWSLKWNCTSSLPLDINFYSSVNIYTEHLPRKYAELINSLLLQHGICIREFSLYLPYDYLSSFSLFESSIILATKSGSIETISFVAGGFFPLQPTLPSSFFFMVNLRYLKIHGFQLNLPSWFRGFPKLIHLGLCSPNLPKAVALSNFVSGCPLLEEVTFMGPQFAGQVLELKAPNLRVLMLFGNFNDVIIANSPKLEFVHIQMVGSSYCKADDYVGKFKFLKCFTQVESMVLCGKICKILGRGNDICMLPRYDRMKILKFHKMDSLDADNLKCVLSIISASPNVAALVLRNSCHWENQADDAFEWMVEKYINDEFRYLTTIGVCLRHGSEKTDMKIIERFLRYSPVLKRMTIRFMYFADETELQHRRAILNFPKASTMVQIEFDKFGE